jgi:hypothetical protein
VNNISDADFEAEINRYNISGYARTNLGGLISGAQVSLMNQDITVIGETFTDSLGYYIFSGLAGAATYIATIQKEHYTFSIPVRTFINLSYNITQIPQQIDDMNEAIGTFTVNDRQFGQNFIDFIFFCSQTLTTYEIEKIKFTLLSKKCLTNNL